MLTYENPCLIVQNQGEIICRAVPKSISGCAYIIRIRWLILGLLGKLFPPYFERWDKPYFFQHCRFWPFNSFYWHQIKLWTPSVLHEFDRLEQTNTHDRSEKFPNPNLMMKTASLHEVKKFWKFDCIRHWSTKWFLAPTVWGPNLFPNYFLKAF